MSAEAPFLEFPLRSLEVHDNVGNLPPELGPWRNWRIRHIDRFIENSRITDVPQFRLPGDIAFDPEVVEQLSVDDPEYIELATDISHAVNEDPNASFDLELLRWPVAIANLQRYQAHSFGEAQQDMDPRYWAHNKQVQEAMSQSEYIEALGDDVGHRTHNEFATAVLQHAVDLDDFISAQTRGWLLLNEITHDVAEAIATDALDGTKDPSHDELETRIGKHVRNYVVARFLHADENTQNIVVPRLQVINYEHLHTPQTETKHPQACREAHYRRKVERAGYFITGISHLVAAQEYDGQQHEALLQLGEDVLTSQRPKIAQIGIGIGSVLLQKEAQVREDIWHAKVY